MTAGIDGGRLLRRIDQLATATAGTGPGVTRLAWSAEWRRATAMLCDWAAGAGADCRVDAAGNVVAERAGWDASADPLVTGSHLDSVPGGGRLDGSYGVVAAWEVLAALGEAGSRLRHPVRAVAFANEEGVVAPPYTGSRAVAGTLDPADVASLSPILRAAGCQPDRLAGAAWPKIAAAVELHVEQGPVLDGEGVRVGVVTAVTGQQRGRIVVTGAANHAGTTPMHLRRDALVAAADLIQFLNDLPGPNGCDAATVGRLDVDPCIPNVIPGRVEMSFDLRCVDDSRMQQALARLADGCATVMDNRQIDVNLSANPATPAVAMDPCLQGLIEQSARSLGLAWKRMPSGAGHDCAILHRLGPVAMIFVPSTGGVSHHFSEATPETCLVDGARVLLHTLLETDRRIGA